MLPILFLCRPAVIADGKAERQSPDTRTLAKLCEIFEVSADYLLFGKEEEKKTEGVYELEIYKEEDRVAVVGILNKNGYATCMVSRLKNPGGKAKKYLVLARPCENGRGLRKLIVDFTVKESLSASSVRGFQP